ncbi:UDP-N-acetylmuramate:L-alanyl-gamma-D-glutamyl-meso-diaminopimelate ligase [candidate division KSB3 bacterium]|uniref:UDP-N-acetylmuramate:L-alanyl-gamma-D-glutamyl-meso-diaminopimelate ligase n=1 Tax=candidate division KSB3 bacterium TaxID=2044937 RepID=A0A9D5JZQ1_9BACT|nr:UDP-N-acetylmuramate:L-alanyl-gamma-D-glutamyl-meso-diaminopimelate ligase [candidate division KSB3 bacterium]MBD3327115.1 UDP-N-acetylmuramate:L-alanyl-gamma-D-glutamyl-meso-diaminopimelate ligase [candidate division KSB3 bacterium]
MNKIHLMAICGMAMGSLAGMLKAAGYDVRGSDEQVYPPMSDQLDRLGIPYFEGFRASNLDWHPDLVVVGNVITRANPEATALRERGLPYASMPETLAKLFIRNRHSIVVTGTHGKTTTSGVIAWTLAQAGRDPGFMIGGVLKNFDTTSQIGTGDDFVVEGDEYDTAYFDKVPKFVHYRPTTGIITSIEYDHADIYENLDRIKREFRKFVDLIPQDGLLVACADDPNVRAVIADSPAPLQTYGQTSEAADWTLGDITPGKPHTAFTACYRGKPFARLHTPLIGTHNLLNLLGATVILNAIGLQPDEIDAGFRTFTGIKRRQEVLGVVNDIVVMDDFAHHPTAVKATIEAVSTSYRLQAAEKGTTRPRLWSVFEPRTAATRRDVFQHDYATAFAATDVAIIARVHKPEKAPEGHRFSAEQLVQDIRAQGVEAAYIPDVDMIVAHLVVHLQPGDMVLIMSNGGFGGIHQKLLTALRQNFS